MCLLIGVNPRYEASLYNLHLRKRLALGGFEIASIGPITDLTYPVNHLGLGTETLKALSEGKHPFFNKMLLSKKPVILLGSQLHKTPDFCLIENLALNLAIKVGAVPSEKGSNNKNTGDWLGYGTLQASAGALGKINLGLKGLNHLDSRKNSSLVFLLGVDPRDLISLKAKKKLISSDILVPLVSTLENSKVTVLSEVTRTINYPIVVSNHVERSKSSFLTTEGDLKQLERVVKPGSFKKDTSELLVRIFDTVLAAVEKRLSVSLKNPNKNLSSEVKHSSQILSLGFNNWKKEHYSLNFPQNSLKSPKDLIGLNFNKKDVVYKQKNSVYNSLFEDFYLTDSLSLSSSRMRRCSSLYRKRAINFFK